jgi:hypothetical protein
MKPYLHQLGGMMWAVHCSRRVQQVLRTLFLFKLSEESSTVQNRVAYHWRPLDCICPDGGSREILTSDTTARLMTDSYWYNGTDSGTPILDVASSPRLQPPSIAVKSPPATIDAPRLGLSLFSLSGLGWSFQISCSVSRVREPPPTARILVQAVP